MLGAIALGGGDSIRWVTLCVDVLLLVLLLVLFEVLLALLLISLVLWDTSCELVKFVFVLFDVEFWVTSLVF
tara:strand:- start:296 stop:511 length:216 start_codon:yes stop_codon:yes gene_type:complete